MIIFDYLFYFWFRCEYDQCSLTEIALYFCLLFEANRQHWASPLKVSTQMLMLRLGTSKQNIIKAREGLMKRGLISYTKGEGKGKPALYTLLLPKEQLQSLSKTMPQQLTQSLTSELTQPLTLINKKENKIHFKKKGTNVPHPSPHQKVVLTLDGLRAKLLSDAEWQDDLSKRLAAVNINISGNALKAKIIDFFEDLSARKITHKDEADCKSHIYNWLKYHNKNNYGNKGNNESKVDRTKISDNRPEDYQGAC